ncbi:MAG: type II toxin-antitoxin system RelE/ParE family toxin [Treponema sp.]|nr:type II toxin-antitoxin system RelE/ParE family toxin [Treponema sp.]
MRIFKNTWFSRFADKESITDAELRSIVNQLETGKADADLGGGVYKVRVSRSGEGKSGGYRVIVFFKTEFRSVFVYGFTKSDRDNIGQGELRAFKNDAKYQMALTNEQIDALLRNKDLIEVFEEAENAI